MTEPRVTRWDSQQILRDKWGGDSVFINIEPSSGAFGAINTRSLKKVNFFVPTTHAEGDQPLPISEPEMREIAQAVFETLKPSPVGWNSALVLHVYHQG